MGPENIDDIVCRTIGGPRPDNPCVFPFIFQGENRTECIEGRLRPKPWCATKVDESNNYIPQEWGICGESCSKSGNLEAPTNSTLVSPKNEEEEAAKIGAQFERIMERSLTQDRFMMKRPFMTMEEQLMQAPLALSVLAKLALIGTEREHQKM